MAHGEREFDEQQAKGDGLIESLMRFEEGDMETDDEVLDLFQGLVDTGLAWQLQGSYGRTAQALIDAGLIRGGN